MGGNTSTLAVVDDSIEAYLSEEVATDDLIDQHGGLLQYCTHQLTHWPRVFGMALDYLTAPGRSISGHLIKLCANIFIAIASSADAERAFSNGRLMMNHLQHQMSSRTFQAQMAVGSWVNTPLLPDLTQAALAVEASM